MALAIVYRSHKMGESSLTPHTEKFMTIRVGLQKKFSSIFTSFKNGLNKVAPIKKIESRILKLWTVPSNAENMRSSIYSVSVVTLLLPYFRSFLSVLHDVNLLRWILSCIDSVLCSYIKFIPKQIGPKIDSHLCLQSSAKME